MKNDSVTILGTRGSVAVSGEKYGKYGGATSSFAVRIDGQLLVIDAGTGILNLPGCMEKDEKTVDLLLTHCHADHILGMLSCPVFYHRDVCVNVYTVNREGLSAGEQIKKLFAPPLWPVGHEMLPAEFRFHELLPEQRIGALNVRATEGCHPGGVSVLRIEGNGKSVVAMTDCTLSEKRISDLSEFSRGCDLLLCDGQYSDAEWERKKTFGHSTWRQAAEFGVLCGAKQIRIVHHDPFHTDVILNKAQKELEEISSGCSFAREGEEIVL